MKKSKKRTIAIILIVLGIVFLISAVIFWIDTLKPSQLAGLDQNLRNLLATIARSGASIKGCVVLLKPKNVSTTDIKVNGVSSQIAVEIRGDTSKHQLIARNRK